MKVCGFSIIKNGVNYDYPFEESIRSILPLCDKFIVAVGKSEDNTLERIVALGPKIEVVETIWDDSLREGGRVLASETNKAMQAIPAEYDWAFYLQSDEIVHESDLPAIKAAMLDNLNKTEIDGLLFNYLHFFGSYDFVGLKYSWYRREIRVIRNRKDFFSYRDAQGFRKAPNDKLVAKLIDARIFHYGYVKEPSALQSKLNNMIKFYRDDQWIEKFFQRKEKYEYESMLEPLVKFEGTHPEVMKSRIARKNWTFKPDLGLKYSSTKDKIKRKIFKWTGWLPGEYRNYKMVR